MSYTCYMIGIIDVATLKVAYVQTASCPASGLTTNLREEFAFDILSFSAPTYEDASRLLHEQLEQYRTFPMYRPFIELYERCQREGRTG